MAANPAKRVAALVGGGLLLVVGVALLVLPGPGLLLVLAGLIILANQFPRLDKYVGPVEKRALIVFASNRGLAGSYNAQIIRFRLL